MAGALTSRAPGGGADAEDAAQQALLGLWAGVALVGTPVVIAAAVRSPPAA